MHGKLQSDVGVIIRRLFHWYCMNRCVLFWRNRSCDDGYVVSKSRADPYFRRESIQSGFDAWTRSFVCTRITSIIRPIMSAGVFLVWSLYELDVATFTQLLLSILSPIRRQQVHHQWCIWNNRHHKLRLQPGVEMSQQESWCMGQTPLSFVLFSNNTDVIQEIALPERTRYPWWKRLDWCDIGVQTSRSRCNVKRIFVEIDFACLFFNFLWLARAVSFSKRFIGGMVMLTLLALMSATQLLWTPMSSRYAKDEPATKDCFVLMKRKGDALFKHLITRRKNCTTRGKNCADCRASTAKSRHRLCAL